MTTVIVLFNLKNDAQRADYERWVKWWAFGGHSQALCVVIVGGPGEQKLSGQMIAAGGLLSIRWPAREARPRRL